MSNLVALLYLSDVVSSTSIILFCVTFVLVTLIITLGISYSDTYVEEKDKRDRLYKGMKRLGKSIISCLLILIILPSSRTMNVLIAGVAVKELSTVQSVNVIGSKAMKVIDTYLDKVIKENIEEKTK